MAGYTRQSTFTDGDIITAAHSNDEFNQLLAAFVASTGHSHDGTAADGGPVTTLRDADSLNKIFVDTTNNHLEFYVEVSSSAVQQLRIQDGAIVPITDNDIDLGTSSLEFKDLHLDGTANIDSLVADTADINGGTVDNAIIGGSTAAAITGTTLVANTSLNIAGDGATVTGIKDEDDMSSNSATKLATQQSIKAYVDAQLTAQDLDFQGDSGGALSIDLDSETLDIAGGTGIDTTGSGNTLTVAIDSTVATLTGSQTLTNKTLTTPIIAEIDSGSTITLDATTDIVLDADGGNVIFKDGGTSILDIANNSTDVELTVSTADKNFAIKGTDGSSAITALDIDMALNGKATFSGDVVVTGDLTVTGDDITMGTNTAGHILVGDDTNFNPVAISGDVTLSSSGAVTIANGAVETAMVNANVITGQTAETSLDTSNDTMLIHDASASALRKVTLASLSSSLGGLSAVSGDSNPQLGGDLDTNDFNIKFDDAHGIQDDSGNELIVFQKTSSAVNQFDVTNAATGSAPSITATGGDTNIDFKIAPKGTGNVVLDGTVVSGAYGSSSSPIILKVTVASKSAHPYQGDGSSSAYYIDGVEAPALTLNGVDNVTSDSGYYYRFDQSDSSNSSHPLRFYLDADKTTAFTTGVTTNGTPGSSGAYTQIDVDEDTPSVLYYQCSSHEYMGNHAVVIGSNKINHSEALISFPTATTTLIGTDTTDTLTNKTLTTPTLTTPIANAGIQLKNGASSAGFLEFFEDSDNGTNKVTLIGPASTADVTLTLPSATDTLVGKATTDTLTNKSIDSDNNTITNIVNADIKSSAAIADTKLDTISTANKVSLTALDIDGATDIGEAVADADLFIIDNGAGGTNRKVTASALKTYAGGSSATKGFATAMAIAL